MRLAKALRQSQPLNFVVTGGVRALLRLSNTQCEAVISHLPHRGHVRDRLPDGSLLRLWSEGDDFLANQVFWRGWRGYEPQVTPTFHSLARRARVTIDVGAHVGFYAMIAGLSNPRGRVYAFEPVPAVWQRLMINLSLNQLPNVSAFPLAVGLHTGRSPIYHVAEGIPSSSSLSQSFFDGYCTPVSTTVDTCTLDEFVEEHEIPCVDLVKIDTESTEPDVLTGGLGLLERDHPDIVCEVLAGRGVENQLEAILFPLGYQTYLLTRRGPIPVSRVPPDTNCLFSTSEVVTLTGRLAPGGSADSPTTPRS